MATRKQEPKANPDLLVSRDEAKSLLSDRIEKGKEILKSNIKSFDDLDVERRKYYNWDKYNTQLLQNIFSNTKISEEYSYYGILVSGAPNLRKDIQEHYDDINIRINRIESIIERLSLFHLANQVNQSQSTQNTTSMKTTTKIFIIHGHDETRLLELEKILKDDFKLTPIILKDQPNGGSTTLIEKFELYAPECSFAIALFTPDDQVENNGKKYLQARPNVIYELGWFCAKLSRKNVLLILKDGTDIFSDFQGILQFKFRDKIVDVYRELHKELQTAQLI